MPRADVTSVIQDLKYALRVLRGNLAVTVAALIALALGIGANTAIFSLIDAVVLQPLPYPQPDRLLAVDATEGRSHQAMHSSWPMVRDWQEQNRVFEHLSAYSRSSVNLTGAGEPLRLYAVRTTPEFFAVMGISPAIGAPFDSSGQAVVVTHGLWLQRFGGDRGAVGSPLVLDGQPYTLAGVLPEGFRFPKTGLMDEPQVYLPLVPDFSRGSHYLQAIGRLKPGITPAQAQADLDVISAAIERAHPKENAGEGAQVFTLRESLIFGSADTLRVFGWAVGLVLLIACANVSNLLLSQAARRQRELAIRSAVGATRARLVRQLLTESLVLSLAGGALGVLLALWSVPMLAAAAPPHTAFSTRIAAGGIQLNGTVLAFTFGVAVLSGLLFGTIPAWNAARFSKLGRATAGNRLRGLLVASEVALALVLLAGAGLLVKSFLRLLSVDPGFRTEHLLTIDVELPEPKYDAPARRAEFVREALARLEHLPGVAAAAAVNALPLTKSNPRNTFGIPGGLKSGSAGFRSVSPGYFGAMGIPLVRGRLLTPADTRGAGVINRAMAERYWPHEDPIGQVIETPRVVRLKTATGFEMRFLPERFEIVGVVGDVRHLSLSATPNPEMFLPYSQMATTDVTFLLRGIGAATLASAAKGAIWGVDRDQPLAAIRTMDQLIGQDLATRRFVLLLLAVFAGVALALAAAGIFGAVLHSVSRRTREIGIRMALGADQVSVVAVVVRQAMVWIGLGLSLGAVGVMASGRLLASYLYGIQPHDAGTLVIAVAAMAAMGAAAAVVPARAAAKVDPAVTLRSE